MEVTHTFAFLAIGLAGIVLNVVEMILILKGRQYRVPFQMSVLSLAVTDLLASLSLAISNTLVLVLKLDPPYPEILTEVHRLSVVFSTISSQLYVIFIAMQRLIAVLLPFSCKRIVTSFRCSVCLALIWIISLTVTGLIQNMADYIHALTVATGVVIALLYALIVYRVRNRPITGSSNSGSEVTLYSGILFLLYVACYFPFVCSAIIYGKDKGFDGPWITVFYLYWLNIVTNPSVYFLFKVFKGGFRRCFKSRTTSVTIQDAPIN